MRCKHCKEKFEPLHFNQKFCFKEECKSVWIATEKEKQWIKRKKEIKEDLKTVQDLFKEVLEVFNSYIRERDKNKPCVSCGAKAGTYTMSSGHYFPQGNNKSIALDERNSHGQCWYNCNSNKSGNLSEYYPELIRRIGQEGYEELQRLRHETKKYTREELKEIKEHYKQKIKELKKNI